MLCKSLLPQLWTRSVDGQQMGIHPCQAHGCNCTPDGHVLPADVVCEDGFRICGERCSDFEPLEPPKEETHFKRLRGELAKSPATGPKLTIGIPYFRDFSGLWATVESISFYHGEAARECEIIVIDNDADGNPNGNRRSDHSAAAAAFCGEIGIQYVHFTSVAGTAAAKGKIFELAHAPAVLVMDCHVLFPPGVLRRLLDLFADNPESKDLYQGPYITGTGTVFATHMTREWSEGMFGKWKTDQRVRSGKPFQIASHGCGMFACNKHAWPGFHPLLRGFGPEESHLQDRVRRNGGVSWCMPWLLWHHRPQCPDRKRPSNFSTAELVRGNTVISLDTGTVDIDSMRAHYVDEKQWMSGDDFDSVVAATRLEWDEWNDKGP